MCKQWNCLSQSWLSSDVKCVFQSPTMPFLSICKWAIHYNTFFIHFIKRIYLMKIGPPSVFFHSLFTFDLQSQELINNIMSDINSVSPGGGKSAPPVMFICANTHTSSDEGRQWPYLGLTKFFLTIGFSLILLMLRKATSLSTPDSSIWAWWNLNTCEERMQQWSYQ